MRFVVKLLQLVLRTFAFLFHLLLGLFLVAVGLMGLSTGRQVRLDVVPGVAPEYLPLTLVAGGLIALLAVAIAFVRGGFLSLLLVLWSLLIPALVICAFTRPSYAFSGPEHLRDLSIFFGLSLLALWGSWIQWRRPRRKPG